MTTEKMEWIAGTNLVTDGDGAYYPIHEANSIRWVKLPEELGGTTHAIASMEMVEKIIEPHAGATQGSITFRKWTLVGCHYYALEDPQNNMFYWCRG